MKRYVFVLILTAGFAATAQTANYSSSLELSGGIAQDGFAASAGYNYYLNRYNYIQGAVYLSFGNIKQDGFEIPYNNFTLNVGYFIRIYNSLDRKFSAAIGLGPVIGLEVVNNGNNELEGGAIVDNSSEFLYGGFAGAELDLYLSESFSLLGKVNQYYHPSSDLGEFALYAGVGLRYILF